MDDEAVPTLSPAVLVPAAHPADLLGLSIEGNVSVGAVSGSTRMIITVDQRIIVAIAVVAICLLMIAVDAWCDRRER